MRTAALLAALAFSVTGASMANAAQGSDRSSERAAAARARQAQTCDSPVTGSHIRRKAGDCTATGYTFRQISPQGSARTGAFDLRSAMRLGDPSFR